MIYLPMPEPVNLPLLREELNEAGVIYSVQFGAENSIVVETIEQSELAQGVIANHDANQLTTDQAQAAQESSAQAVFLASVDAATEAIGSMVVDTQDAIARIQASAIDEAVKAELIAMNMRTVALVIALTPFIEQVIGLIRQHRIDDKNVG